MTPPGDASPLRAVMIALDILEKFFTAPELGVSELARRIGVAKTTAHTLSHVRQAGTQLVWRGSPLG